MKKSFLSMLIGVFMITTGGVAFAAVSKVTVQNTPSFPAYCTPAQMLAPGKTLSNCKLTSEASGKPDTFWKEKSQEPNILGYKVFGPCTVPGSVVYIYKDQR